MEDDAQKVADAVTQGMNDGYVGFFGCNEGTTVAIGNTIKESGCTEQHCRLLIHPTMFWLWFQKVSFMQQWNRSHRRWDMTD